MDDDKVVETTLPDQGERARRDPGTEFRYSREWRFLVTIPAVATDYFLYENVLTRQNLLSFKLYLYTRCECHQANVFGILGRRYRETHKRFTSKPSSLVIRWSLCLLFISNHKHSGVAESFILWFISAR